MHTIYQWHHGKWVLWQKTVQESNNCGKNVQVKLYELYTNHTVNMMKAKRVQGVLVQQIWVYLRMICPYGNCKSHSEMLEISLNSALQFWSTWKCECIMESKAKELCVVIGDSTAVAVSDGSFQNQAGRQRGRSKVQQRKTKLSAVEGHLGRRRIRAHTAANSLACGEYFTHWRN